MTPEQLSRALTDVLDALVRRGELTLPEGAPSTVAIERPRSKDHGDYATNVALQLAKKAQTSPRALAELVAAELRSTSGVAAVEIAGPGFLNITVDAAAQGRVAADIVAAGPGYGHSSEFAGEKINVEFVSANPTGPLHLGGVRWAAVGDALARVLEASGAKVTREYYFNDHGAQIDRFARSLLASARGHEVPEDGYGGEYIHEIATAVLAHRPDAADLPDAEAQEVFRELGVDMMFGEIKQSLHDFKVDFDVYFHEDDLHRSGAVQHAVDRLTSLGNTYEKDGAIWLATEKFGDDKDRVIIKSDGQGAYLSGDLAYYLDKRERGFDRCFIMLGADHHGYVGRMMAMCAAFGDTPHVNLEILIGQMVNLVKDGQPLRMSKRAGTVVTIDDLVEAIGIDASRYALARYSTDSTIDIDLDQWAKADNANPVYYVQYVAARTASILRNAGELGIAGFETLASLAPQPAGASLAPQPAGASLAPQPAGDIDTGLLVHEKEGELLRALAEFPRVVTGAAQLREPHRVARYLEDTAAAFHRFYDECRVLPRGDEEVTDLHRARLLLVAATRQVFVNGLGLLGVSAPERM